jgi:hypothetical protein
VALGDDAGRSSGGLGSVAAGARVVPDAGYLLATTIKMFLATMIKMFLATVVDADVAGVAVVDGVGLGGWAAFELVGWGVTGGASHGLAPSR